MIVAGKAVIYTKRAEDSAHRSEIFEVGRHLHGRGLSGVLGGGGGGLAEGLLSDELGDLLSYFAQKRWEQLRRCVRFQQSMVDTNLTAKKVGTCIHGMVRRT